jgi:uncharacterized repeat protein (TIGR04138 family)
MKGNVEEIAREDGRYNHQAVRFVYEGLTYTVKNVADEPGHVSGELLCEGLRQLALKKWGRLSVLVLNSWGIETTRDFGEIVWLMIGHGLMSAQPKDTIEDFNDIYDFNSAFKNGL